MKQYVVRNRWYLAVALIILAVLVMVWYVSANRAPSLGSYAVAHGTVTESVDVPGSVSSDTSVDLSFQEGGQIAHVYVKEGDAVAAGQTLADLDAPSFSAQLAQANAALAAAQARLDALASGTRPEMLSVDENAVLNAAATLSVQGGNAYTAADDAVRNQIDNLFTNPKSINPIFNIPTSDSQLGIGIVSQRMALEPLLAAWYTALATGNPDTASIVSRADTDLAQIKKYLDTIALAVNGAIPNSGVTAAQLVMYKANVVTARAEIAGTISALTTAESALRAANDQLVLAQAGATPQDIEAQKAVVLQAQAQAQSAQVGVDRASLRAPFSGIARNVSAKIGQVVAPGTPALSLINSGGLKIEAYVSEADVSKIKEGGGANVALDAYGSGTLFPAKIAAIDTAETEVSGSPAYKVTLYFTTPDARIRAGMTANVHIVALERASVLTVPTRLVFGDGTAHFVLVLRDGAVVRQPVSVGITGDDGMVEITAGLSEGDRISNF